MESITSTRTYRFDRPCTDSTDNDHVSVLTGTDSVEEVDEGRVRLSMYLGQLDMPKTAILGQISLEINANRGEDSYLPNFASESPLNYVI